MIDPHKHKQPQHVAINMTAGPSTGALDVDSSREEALYRFRDINWAAYTRVGGFSLGTKEISALKEVESIAKPGNEDNQNAIDDFLLDSGELLGGALLKLIKHVTDSTVLKYALARVEELLPDGLRLRKRVKYFGESIEGAPFLRLLKNDTGYIGYAASHILALFLTIRHNMVDIAAICHWAVQALKLDASNDPNRANVTRAAVASMMVLLRNPEARTSFIKFGGVSAVADLLRNSQHKAQLSYELIFILWTLSFSEDAIEQFNLTNILDILIQQVTMAPREKVVRVALETLKNLLGKLSGYFDERMIDSGLLKTLNIMRDRKWTDDDLVNTINNVRDALVREYKELNTMERYEKEIRTGSLNWGLLHTDKFWKEYYMAFEHKDFELIRMLIGLLESEDSTTVAVALFDLGEFVRFYPNGKHIAKRLGAKKVVMKLMAHEDPEVQKQALQCISKIMVNKWEFVG
uniref:V-type proton ATPase subunit H n=1 Tax=Albugo laibachii Nc14 TaxID=890382 RepID=F0WBE0_9STRA|nr:Vtype proton ATPase subunit H putative [Albugo laibachii Nc14]|eukprot:CCA18464.1 Vtype proton ATPase subunit H putative [Albugo laibachii Nc14]